MGTKQIPLDDSAEIDEYERTHDEDGQEIDDPAPRIETERRRMTRERASD